MTKNTSKPTRREFGKAAGTTAAAAFGFNILPSGSRGNLEKPALAAIGTGGKGRADIEGSQEVGFEVAALVDIVDARNSSDLSGKRLQSIARMREAFPKVRFFVDYREMLAELGDRVDAVTVSTPDHHHFHAYIALA